MLGSPAVGVNGVLDSKHHQRPGIWCIRVGFIEGAQFVSEDFYLEGDNVVCLIVVFDKFLADNSGETADLLPGKGDTQDCKFL